MPKLARQTVMLYKAGKHFLIETDDTAKGKKPDYSEDLQDGDEDEPVPGKGKI